MVRADARSAPDIAGKGRVNPIPMLQRFSMMLRRSFNQGAAADVRGQAIGNVLATGLRTAAIMQEGVAKVSTSTMGESLVREFGQAAG